MLKVTEAEHLQGHQIKLSFNDGTKGIVNLEDHLHGSMFEPLKDTKLFSTVKFCPELKTITWPNGADLAPEFLKSILQ